MAVNKSPSHHHTEKGQPQRLPYHFIIAFSAYVF